MRLSDRQAFDELLDKLSRYFPEREVTQQLRRDYWERLTKFDLNIVRQFAEHHMDRGKFFPKVSELQPQLTKRAPDQVDASTAHQEHMDRQCTRSWDEYMRGDPEEARIRLRLAQCARAECMWPLGDERRTAATIEASRAQRQLMELWERRRTARSDKTVQNTTLRYQSR